MANCPGCGGLLKFDIESQMLKCTSCDSNTDPYQADAVNNAEDNSDYETTVFTCPQCGGELYSTDHDLSGNCSFCGSPVVFEAKMIREKRPDYIIPFGLTKNECKERYMEEIQKNKYAPKELKDPDFIDGFRGIYVPYWLYEVNQHGDFCFRSSYSESHGSYSFVYTDEISGTHDSEYDHIMHDASSVLLDDISEKLEPFETIGNGEEKRRSGVLKPFSTGFFSGFYAEPADVSSGIYESYARGIADENTAGYIKDMPELKKYNVSASTLNKTMVTEIQDKKLAMFPIWFLSYRKNDRVAYAAVNGQTGRVISDTPIDLKAFFKNFAIATAVIFVILSLFTILPVSVTLLSVVMAGLVTRFCHDDLKILVNRTEDAKEGRRRWLAGDTSVTIGEFIAVIVIMLIFKVVAFFENDAVSLVTPGVFFVISIPLIIAHFVRVILIYKDLVKVKNDRPAKFFIYPVMSLCAAVVGACVLFIAPAADYFYYISGAVVIAAELLVFSGIIKNYNRIATRPLPQFSIHKGGDDNA